MSQEMEGFWEGEWESETTGHTGKMECRLIHLFGRHFRAEFKARYWKIFRFSRDIRLTFRPENGSFTCKGSEDLGFWGGGQYQYWGTLDASSFELTFASQKYRGSCRMRRT